MLFILRIIVCKKPSLCALLQDFFIAAEIALLPKSRILFIPLFLYQWVAVLLAHRLKIRLSFALFPLLYNPKPFFDSAKNLRVVPWLLLGLLVALFTPQTLPLSMIIMGLLCGPIAAFWSRRLDFETELLASNPLFYLQWKHLIHPPSKTAASVPTFNFTNEKSISVFSAYPLLRKTIGYTTSKRFEIPIEHPHIIFLFLESFRAQNVGCLGAKIAASPIFDRLAKKGVLFTQCSATGPFTFYAALASLFGIQPSINTYHLLPYMNIPLRSLPSLLKKVGYKTAWIESGYTSFGGTKPFLESHGVDEIIGAEEFDEPGQSWGVYDASMLRYAAQWLETQKTPTFASLFTLTNHHPWIAPPDWVWDPPRNLSDTYNRYLKTFAYTDACLGQFVEELRVRNMLEKTILFITGDHGQQENEATVSLSQQNIHVPLLLYAEGKLAQRTISDPCSHLDLFSTVIDLLQLKEPHHAMGKSLLREQSGPVYFSMPGEPRFQGCREGAYKWTPQGLYHLDNDPFETKNLAFLLKEKNEELRMKTQAHFESIDTLFKNRSFAPKQETPESILITPHTLTDHALKKILQKNFRYSTIDLSDSSKLTDRSLLQVAKTCGPYLRFLRLPPFITDQTLLHLASYCPLLVAFHAQEGLLITSFGVEALLERCSKLKLLSLGNADEIVRLDPKVERLQISTLILGENVPIEGNSLVQLTGKCRQLTVLQANVINTTASQLNSIAESSSELIELCLFNAQAITEEIIRKFCRCNPYLKSFKLTGCTQLSSLKLKEILPPDSKLEI